jgi:hypothetical protein
MRGGPRIALLGTVHLVDGLEASAMDVVYVALTLIFFGLTWAFVKLCERV